MEEAVSEMGEPFDLRIDVPAWPKHTQQKFVNDLFTFIREWKQPPAKLGVVQASITCPICDATSHHPEDVKQGYCGHCHAFTRDCARGSCSKTPTTRFGNISFCTEHAQEMSASLKGMT